MKKKLFLSLIMLILGILFLGAVSVSAETYGNYTYTVSNGEASITDFDESVSGETTIPSEINGYPVTSIGSSAFDDCSSLTSITIGNGVTSIGDCAFYKCSSLTSITIPDSVTSIGKSAFFGCTALISVYITDIAAWCNIDFGLTYSNPLYYAENLYLNNELVTDLVITDDVTEIKNYAFYKYTGLTSVTIPHGVTSIGDSAFYNCTSLTSVYIIDISAWCNIDFDSRYSNPLYYAENLYLNNELVTDLVITDDVTEIKNYAFYKYIGLTSVTISDSVTSIGECAFEHCTGLTSVTIPDGVTSIGDYAFYYCTGLTSVTIPNGVTSIGNCAFSYSTSLSSITIPDSVTSIDNSTFSYCTSLTSITIPDSVTSIGHSAFKDCTGLTSITIPDSVTSIGNSVFAGCIGLTSVTIPDSVTGIRHSAFKDCSSLTSITIPDSVTSIGYSAFYYCSSLTTVYFYGTEEDWSNITIEDGNTPLEEANIEFLNQVRTKTNISEDKKTITVTNINVNSGHIVVLALYNGEQVAEVQYLPCTLSERTFTTDKSYDSAKVMIWESLKTIRPIYNAENVK